jgi:hypothetical protein
MTSYSNPGVNQTDAPSTVPGDTTARAAVAPKITPDTDLNWQTRKVSAEQSIPTTHGSRNRNADPVAKVPGKTSR